MSAAALETALVVHVEQITGDPPPCGASNCRHTAALIVKAAPYGEPGAVCAPHGLEWLAMIERTVRGLWKDQFPHD